MPPTVPGRSGHHQDTVTDLRGNCRRDETCSHPPDAGRGPTVTTWTTIDGGSNLCSLSRGRVAQPHGLT
jgi:hypothetical protein